MIGGVKPYLILYVLGTLLAAYESAPVRKVDIIRSWSLPKAIVRNVTLLSLFVVFGQNKEFKGCTKNRITGSCNIEIIEKIQIPSDICNLIAAVSLISFCFTS
jgi:hypothetical protein